MNFENLTIRLHVIIIFFILVKFLENQRQLLYHQINVKISSFCDIKLCIKNKFIILIVNNIQFEQNLICMLRT